jgi:hypothetical protein
MSNYDIQHFDSIAQFARFVDSVKNKPVEYAEASKKEGRGEGWDLNTDFNEALEIGLNGGLWPEGAKELQSVDITSASESLASIITPAMVNDVTGGAVDIGAYLSDDPECFFRLDEEEQVKPIIRIGVCSVPRCDITSHQLINQGRAIMALIDALEMQGYSTELEALIPFIDNKGRGYIAEIDVKQAGHPWDASSVAYALAHPAFSRRLGFKALEVNERFARITTESYGRGEIPKPEKFDIYFNYLTEKREVVPPENALSYVTDIAKKQAPQLIIK